MVNSGRTKRTKFSTVSSTRTPARPPQRWIGGAFRTFSMSSSMGTLDRVVRVHVDLELHVLRCRCTRSLRPLLGLLQIDPGEEVGDGLRREVLHRSLTSHHLHPDGARLTPLLHQAS